MKIGVDAGTLSVSDERLKVGVYRVVSNLLQGLGRLDKTNSYTLYSFAAIEPAVMGQFGHRMKNAVLKPLIGWFTLRLPLELRMHPVDIFLGAAQAVPPSSAYSIGFVYDVGFIHAPQAYPGSLSRLKEQTVGVVKRASGIVAISQSTKDDLVKQYGYEKSKITVVYPGIDSRFTQKGTKTLRNNPYFLFVGALKPGKNVPAIIRAFAQILTKSKKTFDLLLIGGDYWQDPQIEQTIQDLGIGERVIRMGHVPDEDLPAYYRGAVALVNPSLWEGFCLPAAEAMACGCPVIASTAGSLPEILGGGGVLIDPTDTDALVKAMLRVSSDTNLRQSMIQKGLERAKVFSWDTFARTTLDIINRSRI